MRWMKQLATILAVSLLPCAAFADELSAALSGQGDRQGFASIVTGNGSITYNILVSGIGTPMSAEIRQGNSTVVDLDPTFTFGFAAGSTSTAANLSMVNANPGNFTVRVEGSNGFAQGPLESAGTGQPPQGAGTIAFTSASYLGAENGGEATITVSRSGGTSGAVSVDFATADGTAVAGTDYTAVTQTVSWANGDGATKQVTIPLIDNGDEDGDRTVDLALSNVSGGASLGTAGAELTIQDDESGPVAGGPCVPDDTTACLNNGRFEVRMDWLAPDGSSGEGQAVELTDDTAYFWFFNQANVEAVIKVLRACNQNGHYWVFAGGLTNLRVDITVRDTEAEVTKTYRNPQRTDFATITDTGAFATCP